MLARYPSRDHGRFEFEEPHSPSPTNKQRSHSFNSQRNIQKSNEPSSQTRLSELSEVVDSITQERAEMRKQLAEMEAKLATAVQEMQKEKYSSLGRSQASDEWNTTAPIIQRVPSKRESKTGHKKTEETKEESKGVASRKNVGKEESSKSIGFTRRFSQDRKGVSDSKLTINTANTNSNTRDIKRRSSSSFKITRTISQASSLSDDEEDDNDTIDLDTIMPMSNHHNKRSNSFSTARDRIFSFSVDGMTAAEVEQHVIRHTSVHQRSEEEVDHKIVSVRRDPRLLEEPHEETFFELFYDLILVVVFIKLSYLKYDMSASGILTVAAIFSNFWSCWSLMNCYATMLHTEDMVHRVYYVLHITASFIMAITIEHPSHDFFNYEKMVRE